MLSQFSRASNGALSCLSVSAGTAAADGSPADPRGIKVARELGIDLSGHRSRPLGQEAIDRADLILVMDYLNEADVLGQFPGAASKVRLLGSFGSGRHRPQEIRDPFSGTEDDVRAAFVLISAAVRDLVSSISLAQAPSSGNSRTGAA
jgi:protein-tyrosine phosphatase